MLKLIGEIFLFLICGVAPIVALIWIFAAGNKSAKAKKALLESQTVTDSEND